MLTGYDTKNEVDEKINSALSNYQPKGSYVTKKTTITGTGSGTQFTVDVSPFFQDADTKPAMAKLQLIGSTNLYFTALLSIGRYSRSYSCSYAWKDSHIQNITINQNGVITVTTTSTVYAINIAVTDPAEWLTS